MSDPRRYAIVTPYYKEERWLIERCIRSVQAQTVGADHFLIADGHPQDWIDAEPVRHLRLDRSHGDYGNTPRTVGALLAVSEGYQGIGFLDADNWLEKDHVSTCITASLLKQDCDYVIAKRNLCRPDGSVINVDDYPESMFVDTNCFFLLPGSYHAIPHFGLMPIELSPICDGVFLRALRAKNLTVAVTQTKTVNYHCIWRFVYEKAGETPPPNAKRGVNYESMKRWLADQSPRQKEIIRRRIGHDVGINIGTRS
jgi:glycosyltransferase involved in cell wall biosynthesis